MSPRIPDHIARITPYVPGTPIEEAERRLGIRQVVKLASNENPLGPSPRAIEAMREAGARVHRYPDGSGFVLRRALSGRLGVPMEQIVLGNGSTELLDVLARTLLGPDRAAVVAERAFIMYALAARVMGARLTVVPMRDETHDLEAMAAACDAATALVTIGNPNNPTGTYAGRAALASYFERVPPHVLTVVDEAYRDYVEAPDYPDGLEFLRAGRAVAVLRTFSKIHGLAGMRIGYAVTTAEVARALDAVRSPFNTSLLAQAAARAALEDEEHVRRSREANRGEREFLAQGLGRRGVRFTPGVANFLLVHTDVAGEELYRRLMRRGVIVRPMEGYGYPRSIRVSVGTRAENERFLEALEAALAGPRGLTDAASGGRPGAA
jgi:histidinol-phosphate aminotransferase